MLTLPPHLHLPSRLRRGVSALWNDTDGGWYGPRGACGCCEQCSIFTDDFNRADDTDLGSDWSEVSGSWSITSNTLRTSSTSAVCIHDNGNSVADMSVVAYVKGPSGSFGRVIAGYQDSSNYWFAEVKFGASGTGRFDLYQRSGGTNTLKDGGTLTVAPDTSFKVTLCIQFGEGSNLDTISAWIDTISGYTGRWSQHSLTTQDGCGVGTGGTVGAGVEFDSFSVARAGGDCPDCVMPCSTCAGSGLAPHAFDIYIPEIIVRGAPGCTTCPSFGDKIYRAYQCGNCKWLADAGSCTFGSTTYHYRVALWLIVQQSIWFYREGASRSSDASVCSASGFDPAFENHYSQWDYSGGGNMDCYDTVTDWVQVSRIAPNGACWMDLAGGLPYTVPVL